MDRSRSSTSSSRAFFRDAVVAVALLAGVEAYLAVTLTAFERPRAAGPAAHPGVAALPANLFLIDERRPETLVADLRGRDLDGCLLFVGDSQGMGARDGGPAYPAILAQRLADRGTAVVSIHMGGANVYEQGVLILALLQGGLRPRAVIWSHSIFSQRKSEIRAELLPVYQGVAGRMRELAPHVILPAAGAAGAGGGETPGRRSLPASAREFCSAALTRTATARFMRRPLVEKGEILRRSPLGRLIPARFLPGTARQFDPPASILRDSAHFAGKVSAELVARGIRVVDFLAPANRRASPRPFSPGAEAVSFPALRAAAEGAGASFLDLVDVVPADRYGTYSDGTPDAFHLDSAAHEDLATILGRSIGLEP